MDTTTAALRIRQMLDLQVQCALATQGVEAPSLHLMAYAVSDDLSDVFVASPADTTKVENMRARPPVALMWDNRTGSLSDHVEGTVLTARAAARELCGEERSHAVAALASRNASLEGLLSAGTTAVFALAVETYGLGIGYSDHTNYVPQRGAP